MALCGNLYTESDLLSREEMLAKGASRILSSQNSDSKHPDILKAYVEATKKKINLKNCKTISEGKVILNEIKSFWSITSNNSSVTTKIK